ncbi:hypothetical protein R6Q59_006171 [Mikania micrantha]
MKSQRNGVKMADEIQTGAKIVYETQTGSDRRKIAREESCLKSENRRRRVNWSRPQGKNRRAKAIVQRSKMEQGFSRFACLSEELKFGNRN